MSSKKSKQKASSKKSGMSKAELQSSVSSVQGQLAKTEAKLAKAQDKAERWKKEATAQRRSAASSQQRVDKLTKKLNRPEAGGQAAPARKTAARRAPAKTAASGTGSAPDQSWTVVRLRAEARKRGLVGMSNKPKAQLLAALS